MDGQRYWDDTNKLRDTIDDQIKERRKLEVKIDELEEYTKQLKALAGIPDRKRVVRTRRVSNGE